MNCCCDKKEQAITIVKGNDTNANGTHLLSIYLKDSLIDLSQATATFTLCGITKTFDDLSEGVIYLDYTNQQTNQMPVGINYGTLNIIENGNIISTLDNMIAFNVVKNVHGNALGTQPYNYTFEVKQAGETILNIDVKSYLMKIEVGDVETLPAGSQAYVRNSGTANEAIFNFGIPQGADGADGKDGEDGQDATINGVNTLTLTASDGLTLEQEGSVANISGATLSGQISDINDLIPEQASSSNQLADKAFVNSTTQTATANFRGNWATWEVVPTNAEDYPLDYAQSRTPTVNDYLVVQDASGYTGETLTGTWRFKYSGEWSVNGKNGWHPEYQVNETPLTAAQLAALNSGATQENIAQISINKNAIGTLSSLTTTDKSSLVGALNELNSSKQATITGGASTITSANLTANRTLISNAQGKVAVSPVTNTELYYLSGATSSIQTQLNGKASTSLDNLTSTGKNIGNWSTNVSNCITEIPQDIKLELNNGTLTLKSGSVVTKPDGTQYQTTSDTSTTITSNGTYFIFPRTPNVAISTYSSPNRVGSGSTLPEDSSTYAIFFNTTENIIYNWNWSLNRWVSIGLGFPIAIVTVSNGAISSIDKTFNGFGYIGNHSYMLPGVTVLVADRYNSDGTLKSIKHTNSSLLISSFGAYTSSGYMIFQNGNIFKPDVYSGFFFQDETPTLTQNKYEYWWCQKDNKWYGHTNTQTSWLERDIVIVGEYGKDSTTFTTFDITKPVRLVTTDILKDLSGYYGTCSTASATQTKDVICPNFILSTGASVRVKFTYDQGYNGNPLLNVNGTGAISIKRYGTTNAARYEWVAGEVIDFTYDGTNWIINEGAPAGTSNYGKVMLTNTITSTATSIYAPTISSINSLVQNMIEPYDVYSASSTYKVGDRVRYNYKAWECNTAITTAEAWNSGHWTALPAIQSQLDITNNRLSNCILDIPQDIKFELNNGTLTLKSGSVITLPDGTQKQTTQDNSITVTQNDTWVAFPRNNGFALNYVRLSMIGSGSTLPADDTNYQCFFNSTDGLIYLWNNNAWGVWNSALPVCIFTVTNGAVSSIDKVFNGAGYIGSSTFILPGVKSLIPDGFNADGSLKSISSTVNSLIIANNPGGYTSFRYLVSSGNISPILDYDENTNYNNTSNGHWSVCCLATFDLTVSGDVKTISNFDIRQPVRLATTEMLDTKQDKSGIQTLSATDSITLADNTIYNGGEQTALTTALPAMVDVSFLCEIDFTSGTTATTLSYPNSIKWFGTDVSGGVFVPTTSTRYTLLFYFDGVQYVCIVKGIV